MRGRGLLILLAVLVLLLSGLSSLRSSSEQQPSKTAAPATGPAAASAPAEADGEVSAVMPADSVVKVKAGQRLKLEVRAATPDIALIDGLGLSFPVGPDVPGGIVLVAPSSGSFEVTLQIAEQKVGEIIVSG